MNCFNKFVILISLVVYIQGSKTEGNYDILNIGGNNILQKTPILAAQNWCKKSIAACELNSDCQSTYQETFKCISDSEKQSNELKDIVIQCMQDSYKSKTKSENQKEEQKWKGVWDTVEQCFEYTLKVLVQN